MFWGWLIPGWLRRGVFWAVGAAVAVFGIWTAGKREERLRGKNEALRADNEALTERERIEDDVAGDPDLADRAKRSIVRKPRQ